MVHWNVVYGQPPAAVRFCSKCKEKRPYISTGRFRVNANGNRLDIWLIYRCQDCGHTWNLEVLSRISCDALPHELLKQYMENDSMLAFACAMDSIRLAQAGAEPGEIQFEVLGKLPELTKEEEITIHSEFSTQVRASAVLRKKLGFSAKEFRQAVQEGRLAARDGRDLKRCKIGRELLLSYRPFFKSL